MIMKILTCNPGHNVLNCVFVCESNEARCLFDGAMPASFVVDFFEDVVIILALLNVTHHPTKIKRGTNNDGLEIMGPIGSNGNQ